jgi:hypothetical protein
MFAAGTAANVSLKAFRDVRFDTSMGPKVKAPRRSEKKLVETYYRRRKVPEYRQQK